MKNLNLALIGVGYWGKNLLRTLNNMNVLVAVFDTNLGSIDRYSDDTVYKNLYFDTNWENCLGRSFVDGVVIATPPKTHFNIAKKALKEGKHVFIEKPVTLNESDAVCLKKIAEERGLVVSTGHIFLYSPEIIKLKEIINSEDFGDIHYIYTRRLNLGQVQECGVVEDLMPHDISILDYLTDSYCTKVSTHGISHILKDVEDVSFVDMQYNNGVTAHLHLSWLDPLKVRDTVVVGSKQMAVCDSIGKKITVYNKGIKYEQDKGKLSDDYARHLMRYKYGDIVIPYIDTYEPLLEECKDFCYCIKNNTTPKSSIDVGIAVVRTMEAAKRSLEENGKWENV